MEEYVQLGASECIQNLATTDEVWGHQRGVVKALEFKLKICLSQQFLKADAKTAAEREHLARASQEYIDMVQEYKGQVTDLDTIGARRKTWELTIEVFRSQNAARNRGNI